MKSELVLSAPITINWAVTNRCNFGCRHCYSRDDTSIELDLETLCGLIKKIAEAKVFSVNFGGGEPLLRKDLCDISRHASALGLAVSMNSNGFFIDRDTAFRLKEAMRRLYMRWSF